jgi:hypothetical protein
LYGFGYGMDMNCLEVHGSTIWLYKDSDIHGYREFVYRASGVLEEGSRSIGATVSDTEREEVYSFGRQYQIQQGNHRSGGMAAADFG